MRRIYVQRESRNANVFELYVGNDTNRGVQLVPLPNGVEYISV